MLKRLIELPLWIALYGAWTIVLIIEWLTDDGSPPRRKLREGS